MSQGKDPIESRVRDWFKNELPGYVANYLLPRELEKFVTFVKEIAGDHSTAHRQLSILLELISTRLLPLFQKVEEIQQLAERIDKRCERIERRLGISGTKE